MKRGRVAVVMGGWSTEREVSLMTGRAMVRALRTVKVPVLAMDLRTPAQVPGMLARLRPGWDTVLIALHGPFGEDGTLQGLLELARVAYTGSNMAGSALAMDKVLAKERFTACGIPTPAGRAVRAGERVPSPGRYPVVVKPVDQGSSVGVTLAENGAQFRQGLRRAFRYGDRVLVERCIRGRELAVGVLDGRPLPVVEILPKRKFYDYVAKYHQGMSDHRVPASLSPAVTRKVQTLARRACLALGCEGAPRVDLMMDRGGRLFVLEVNTLPGMTGTSLLPEAAAAAGIAFPELLLRMVRAAQRRARS